MDRSSLKERAADISKTANFLSDELAHLGLPEPSFEQGLPAPLHSDAPDSNAGTASDARRIPCSADRAHPSLDPRAGKSMRANIFYMYLLTMTQTAQPIDQCALHCPPGHCGELPTSGNYSPGSCKQAQPPREPDKTPACSLRNASRLLPGFSRFFRAHGGLQSARGE